MLETLTASGKCSSQNLGRVYESFADGGTYPTFGDALQRHQFLDAMFESAAKSDAQITI